MGNFMKLCEVVLVVGLCAAVAVSETEESASLDVSAASSTSAASAKPTVAKLQSKLAKLESTFQRVKSSCVANNVPHEMGDEELGEALLVVLHPKGQAKKAM